MERNLLIKEIADLSSRDYFWRQPTMPAKFYGRNFSASEKKRMVNQIQSDCAAELNLWSGKRETDPGMYDVVKGYWENGVGLGATEAAKIIQERERDVRDITVKGEDRRHPWSAAFVSFIMRKAYPDFKKSMAHNRYIQWAKENRDTNAHPFQAFRVDEVAVEPGDIICYARSKKDWASYDSVRGKFTHGDIVTRIQNGYAVTVGGNVNEKVLEKVNSYRLDSNGYLQQVYVRIKKKSLPKFIAIIKLLPYYEKGYMVTNDTQSFERSGMADLIGYDWDQELTLPRNNSKEWRTVRSGFTKVFWDITPKKKGGESSERYEARKTTFIDRIHGILTAARKDPNDWFNSFTNISFLGITINSPIHVELATHLTLVEKEFVKKYGSAQAAAKTLGLSQSISGGRGESATAATSMHTFGLALDIERHNNPHLGGAIPFKKNKKMMDRLKKDIYILAKAPENPEKMEVLNVIFKRAGVLINGTESTYPTGYSYGTRLDLYDQLKVLNALTVKYFNLVDNTPELASLLKANNLKEWKDKSADDALLLIKKDYGWFRALVVRYLKEVWVKKRGARKKVKEEVQDMVIKEKGFLNLDRRLVDDLGLDWGATYGDIMHFDMRNTGVGKEIDRYR
jgi:hypothetical protein